MQVPIPDDWDGESTCKWAICWPDSIKWRAILYGLIEQPRQGRFWDANTGNIIATQNSFYPMYLYNFDLKEVIMACGDNNIALALDNIAAALRGTAGTSGGSNCCFTVTNVINNSIQGTTTQPIGGNDIPVYGSQPSLALPSGEFPPNYPDEASYLVDKCRLANMIADGIIQTFRNLGSLTVFNITALAGLIGLAIAGIIVFPPAAIPIMIAAIIALAVEVAVLDTAADEIESRRDDLVCILYNSDTVATLIGVLADFIDMVIDAISVTGTVGATIKTIFLLLVNTDALNQLFNGVAALGYPDADCTTCNCDILTYDFTDNDNGYDFASDSCFGTTPSSAGSSVAWDATGLEMIAPNVGNPNAINAAGPSDENIEILAGWEIVIGGFRVSDNANFLRVDVVTTEDGCTQITTGGFTSTSTTEVIASLDTWEGKHIEQINLYLNNTTGLEVDVKIEYILIRCAE